MVCLQKQPTGTESAQMNFSANNLTPGLISTVLADKSIEKPTPNRPLKIVHVGKYYPPANGGIETHTQNLARAQAELGAQVRVLVVNHRDSQGDDVTFRTWRRTLTVEDTDNGVRIYRVGRLACLAKLDWAPGLLRALRILNRDTPDIWHLHTPNVTMMLALASFYRVRPLVITHHSDIIRQKWLRHLIRPIERRVYGRALRILTTSDSYISGSDLLQHYSDKVSAVPLGIELDSFQNPSATALRQADNFRNLHGQPLWLCVGRLIYYKGFDNAINALKDVPGKLMIIGNGPLELSLRQQAARLGVADRVIWMGKASHDELVGAYRAATALWFPSNARSEGFGLVQVEAMACGTPVINSEIAGSGVSWVSRDGDTGLTVPKNDPLALARASRRLLEEPGLREEFALRCPERAAGEFCYHRMAERSMQAYESLL